MTNTAVKQKAIEIVKKAPKINKIKDVILEKDNDLTSGFFETKKSPRKLAIVFQNKIKKKENSKLKLPNQYLLRR